MHDSSRAVQCCLPRSTSWTIQRGVRSIWHAGWYLPVHHQWCQPVHEQHCIPGSCCLGAQDKIPAGSMDAAAVILCEHSRMPLPSSAHMISGDVFLHREDFSIKLVDGTINSGSFKAVLVKGIMANWLLCMAVWQATAAQDVTGKLLGVLFPISAYVTMGLEHCIANCFMYPLAMKLGAPITINTFIANVLVPSTLGNMIGGSCCVAVAYIIYI